MSEAVHIEGYPGEYIFQAGGFFFQRNPSWWFAGTILSSLTELSNEGCRNLTACLVGLTDPCGMWPFCTKSSDVFSENQLIPLTYMRLTQ
jgi:hypothetical protein